MLFAESAKFCAGCHAFERFARKHAAFDDRHAGKVAKARRSMATQFISADPASGAMRW
jgi:hypothetical protein